MRKAADSVKKAVDETAGKATPPPTDAGKLTPPPTDASKEAKKGLKDKKTEAHIYIYIYI